jgi:O-antigen/teichoic acid export membrane protein
MLLGFISFPVFTRVFSVAEYGAMSLVLKVVLLMTVIGKFGLQNSVQRSYAEEGASPDPEIRRRYYSTLFFGAGGMGALAAVFFAATLFLLPESLLSGPLRLLFLIASVLIFLRAVQPTLIGFLRAEGRTKSYNAVEISVKAGTIALACGLLLWWKKSLVVFFGSTIAVEALGVLALIYYLHRRGVLSPRSADWSYFRHAAWFAFPLIGYELASVVLDSGDRLLVQHYLGAQSLGYYSAAYNVSTYAEEALMVPINLALFPIYMKLWVEKGKEETQAFLSRSLNNFLALAVAVICAVFLTSRDVIVVLASKKFQEAHALLPLLIIGLLIYAVHIFLNAALLIYKKTAVMTGLVAGACVANLLLNIALIPRLGLQGAAIATLVSYLLLVLMMGRVSLRLLPLKIGYAGLGINLLAAAVTYFAIRPLDFHHALLNAAVKGLLSLALYAILISLLNPAIRQTLLQWRRPRIAKPETASAKLAANWEGR